MQKQIIAAILLMASFLSYSQELSKEEKKRLKDELKTYMGDLEGYKAKMTDLRNNLDSNDAEIKRLKDDLAYAATQQAELETKVAGCETKLKACEAEKAVKVEPASSAASNKETAPADATDYSKMPAGTIYKVQIGLYKEFSINKYFDQPRFIGYEDVDGMNRYIISYFPDEQIAQDFVKDVRKMGIKDAFVSKYIDGQRVYEWSKNPKYAGKPEPASLQEALEMQKKAKKKPASDDGSSN